MCEYDILHQRAQPSLRKMVQYSLRRFGEAIESLAFSAFCWWLFDLRIEGRRLVYVIRYYHSRHERYMLCCQHTDIQQKANISFQNGEKTFAYQAIVMLLGSKYN